MSTREGAHFPINKRDHAAVPLIEAIQTAVTCLKLISMVM